MDKSTLVEMDINEGKELIEALDKAGVSVQAALWIYLSEPDEWRFMIAIPMIDEEGPKKTYTYIQSILAKITQPTIALKDISIVSPNYDLIKLLKMVISTGPGIHGIRMKRNTVNNVFIEDVYIYRIQ